MLKLRASLDKLVTEMGAMLNVAETEDRDFTADELKVYDEKKVEAEAIRNRIKRKEEFEENEKALPRQTTDQQPTSNVIHRYLKIFCCYQELPFSRPPASLRLKCRRIA